MLKIPTLRIECTRGGHACQLEYMLPVRIHAVVQIGDIYYDRMEKFLNITSVLLLLLFLIIDIFLYDRTISKQNFV